MSFDDRALIVLFFFVFLAHHSHFLLTGLRDPPYWSPYSRPRLIIHTVINSKYFDLAIAGVIGLNVVTMAMEYYRMPQVSTVVMTSCICQLYLSLKQNVIMLSFITGCYYKVC